MDSAKYVTQHKRIYKTIGKKTKQKNTKIKTSTICNTIKCAGQFTVDLIHNNISRYVQEECADRLYRVYT